MAMATTADPLARLQEYCAKLRETEYALETGEPEDDYGFRVTKTLQSLQNQVKQNEAALEKVCCHLCWTDPTFLTRDQLRANVPPVAIDEPSQDPKKRIEQLRTLTTAHKTLTHTKPLLPLSNSPLPALLAMRSTLNLVDQTKVSIKKTSKDITDARERLRWEESNLRDARATTLVLEKKIETLKIENERQSQSVPEELAKAMIQAEQQRRRKYINELKKLVKVFNTFVDEHLAAMIAAEDLGGPVVGDAVDVDDDALKAGFNQHSKSKKKYAGNGMLEAKRRRRNEEIWGSGEEDSNPEPRSEREAAGADFRSLTEDLLNASAGDDDSNVYINIRRESAAVRFLVRAKVAEFHPDDARQLRLVDIETERGEFI